MIAIKLAFRNLLGAGLRTWLNVSVLSFAYVLIIFWNGMLNGWDRQGSRDTKEWEAGEGQLWHPAYDKYDIFSIQDAHAPVAGEVKTLVAEGKLTPVLITQATAYPQGRQLGILIKGIDPAQRILKIPSGLLNKDSGTHYAIIGKRMAKSAQLKAGDNMLIRWRDKNGTFDALEVTIAGIFKTNVPAVDYGQLWMSLETVREMTGMPGEATLLVSGSKDINHNIGNWEYKDLNFLLADLTQIIKSKRASSMIIQGMLLLIALLAIFDTQVLSIFRRQKEIGTYIALGMTRMKVVGIFTVEGAAHSILAALLGAVYGIPLFVWLAEKGISFGVNDMGITMAETIFPYYSMGLIAATTVFVIVAATIVSYIPARRISRMKPTDALKGKIQ
jgi:ABC-type lipoprotein release transport system permease subunit